MPASFHLLCLTHLKGLPLATKGIVGPDGGGQSKEDSGGKHLGVVSMLPSSGRLWDTTKEELRLSALCGNLQMNFLIFKLVLEKAEEPEIKLPTSARSWEKQESSRKKSLPLLY